MDSCSEVIYWEEEERSEAEAAGNYGASPEVSSFLHLFPFKDGTISTREDAERQDLVKGGGG